MIYVNSIISIMLIVCCLIKKNSKYLFYVMFGWMWFLFTFSYGTADYDMYHALYEGTLNNKVEYGFTLLCEIFNLMHIPYQVFVGIYGIIGLSLVAVTIHKFSSKKSLVAACYFIFPFVFDAIQLRNFMALSLIIFALRFLIRNNKFDWLKYLILNIIAISFHTFAIICLFFLLLNFISKKRLYIICTLGAIVEFVILLNKNILIEFLSLFVKESKIEAYFISMTYMPRNIYSIKIDNYIWFDDCYYGIYK